MINSLDEAIKHCEEKAEELDMKADFETDYQCYQMSDAERNQCKECANEHRQLAEWLRELKAYREELPREIIEAKKRQADALEANVKGNYNSHLAEYIKGYLCGLSYTEGIIAKVIEEVNADE